MEHDDAGGKYGSKEVKKKSEVALDGEENFPLSRENDACAASLAGSGMQRSVIALRDRSRQNGDPLERMYDDG
jgi:hypothetical protein